MFQRIRRSFRKKKASVCINCGHANRECYHKEYENIKDLAQNKADQLKWLDLDFQNANSVPVLPNNLNTSSSISVQHRQRLSNGVQQRPHSVHNEYSNLQTVRTFFSKKFAADILFLEYMYIIIYVETIQY